MIFNVVAITLDNRGKKGHTVSDSIISIGAKYRRFSCNFNLYESAVFEESERACFDITRHRDRRGKREARKESRSFGCVQDKREIIAGPWRVTGCKRSDGYYDCNCISIRWHLVAVSWTTTGCFHLTSNNRQKCFWFANGSHPRGIFLRSNKCAPR